MLLFFAMEKMPYGYYTFTRIIVCGFGAFIAVIGWDNSSNRIWSVLFGMLAVLFNPIVPIYLNRATWAYFDVGGAIMIAVHLAFVRLGWLRTKDT